MTGNLQRQKCCFNSWSVMATKRTDLSEEWRVFHMIPLHKTILTNFKTRA